MKTSQLKNRKHQQDYIPNFVQYQLKKLSRDERQSSERVRLLLAWLYQFRSEVALGLYRKHGCKTGGRKVATEDTLSSANIRNRDDKTFSHLSTFDMKSNSSARKTVPQKTVKYRSNLS